MTEKEVTKILAVLMALYPNDFKIDKDDAMKKNLLQNVWFKQFKDYSYEQVSSAIHAYIANDIYNKCPTIGKLKQLIQETNAPSITPLEAWNMVYKALSSGNVHENYKKLPKEIQKCVTPEQLTEWGYFTDVKTCQTVIASNFQKSFAARSQYLKQQDNIPVFAKIKMQENKQIDTRKDEMKKLSEFKEMLESKTKE